jgi:hypothetical protein
MKMAKKQYFAIIDTETTIADTVADCAIIICDRNGIIYNQMAVLVKDQFDTTDLFYDKNAKGLWSIEYAKEKRIKYNNMLNAGSRTMASVNAINNWINLAIGKYNPTLTAYNLPFDNNKCQNTGINLTGFADRFDLWGAAVGNICKTKSYRQFCLENHLFNNVTLQGNMTFKTSAESVTGYLNGIMSDEPHTALEDIIGYELPVLKHIIAKKNWKDKVTPYNWREFQVKDSFIAK